MQKLSTAFYLLVIMLFAQSCMVSENFEIETDRAFSTSTTQIEIDAIGNTIESVFVEELGHTNEDESGTVFSILMSYVSYRKSTYLNQAIEFESGRLEDAYFTEIFNSGGDEKWRTDDDVVGGYYAEGNYHDGDKEYEIDFIQHCTPCDQMAVFSTENIDRYVERTDYLEAGCTISELRTYTGSGDDGVWFTTDDELHQPGGIIWGVHRREKNCNDGYQENLELTGLGGDKQFSTVDDLMLSREIVFPSVELENGRVELANIKEEYGYYGYDDSTFEVFKRGRVATYREDGSLAYVEEFLPDTVDDVFTGDELRTHKIEYNTLSDENGRRLQRKVRHRYIQSLVARETPMTEIVEYVDFDKREHDDYIETIVTEYSSPGVDGEWFTKDDFVTRKDTIKDYSRKAVLEIRPIDETWEVMH